MRIGPRDPSEGAFLIPVRRSGSCRLACAVRNGPRGATEGPFLIHARAFPVLVTSGPRACTGRLVPAPSAPLAWITGRDRERAAEAFGRGDSDPLRRVGARVAEVWDRECAPERLGRRDSDPVSAQGASPASSPRVALGCGWGIGKVPRGRSGGAEVIPVPVSRSAKRLTRESGEALEGDGQAAWPRRNPASKPRSNARSAIRCARWPWPWPWPRCA